MSVLGSYEVHKSDHDFNKEVFKCNSIGKTY